MNCSIKLQEKSTVIFDQDLLLEYRQEQIDAFYKYKRMKYNLYIEYKKEKYATFLKYEDKQRNKNK